MEEIHRIEATKIRQRQNREAQRRKREYLTQCNICITLLRFLGSATRELECRITILELKLRAIFAILQTHGIDLNRELPAVTEELDRPTIIHSESVQRKGTPKRGRSSSPVCGNGKPLCLFHRHAIGSINLASGYECQLFDWGFELDDSTTWNKAWLS
jgi:hypothetical protein